MGNSGDEDEEGQDEYYSSIPARDMAQGVKDFLEMNQTTQLSETLPQTGDTSHKGP